MLAPALAASTHAAAICAGVTGIAGCLGLKGAFPVTAQVRMTLEFIYSRSMWVVAAARARENRQIPAEKPSSASTQEPCMARAASLARNVAMAAMSSTEE